MYIRQLNNNDYDKHFEIINMYKDDIGEEHITTNQHKKIIQAIENGQIRFYCVFEENVLIATCSISQGFSTYLCEPFGVFEDFYIRPEKRKQGIAKKLCSYVIEEERKNRINSIWVGSADCDVEMYQYLGFELALGNLLTSI